MKQNKNGDACYRQIFVPLKTPITFGRSIDLERKNIPVCIIFEYISSQTIM